jgi:hypothetical protein
MNYGITEMKVDKQELYENLNKKIQRVAYDLWFNTLKNKDKLYIVE